MNILEKIIAHKKIEVSQKKISVPISILENQNYFEKKIISLKDGLLRNDKAGIISEFKRRSPSKPDINIHAKIKTVVKGYETAGASGISVLTDLDFFGGKNEDLLEARDLVKIPILRKDFIIDEYQVIESKAIGADVILLIAAAMNPRQIKELGKLAKSLNLQVLLEIHNEKELNYSLNEFVDFVGVNNRDLNTFELSLDNSLKLSPLIPEAFLKISESGLKNPDDIFRLKKSGFSGFLMGETFMKENDPGLACAEFIKSLSASPDSSIEFRKAILSDLPAIGILAAKIWREVYPEIISIDQIEYMLKKMYSQESLKKQFSEHHREYSLVFTGENLIGYLERSSQNGNDYFLHKLYLDTSFHGKGISQKLFDFAFSEKKGLHSVRLQVNRKNHRAIQFYRKLGFQIELEKDFDIGNGFYMNDFIMVKNFRNGPET